MTQERLGKALGRPQSFVAKVEKGERRIVVVELGHLAQISIDSAAIIQEIIEKLPGITPDWRLSGNRVSADFSLSRIAVFNAAVKSETAPPAHYAKYVESQ